MPHRLPPGAVESFLELIADPDSARPVLDRFEKYLSIYVDPTTHDARSAQPETLQTPEAGYLKTGGVKLSGPTDEHPSGLHDGRPTLETLRLKEAS